MVSIKIKHAINLHKVLTPFFVLALMHHYNNWGVGMVTYLALHGTYCVNWMLKDSLYGDKNWDIARPLGRALMTFVFVTGYWSAPVFLVRSNKDPSLFTVGMAISLNILGNMLHYGSDCQKHFTLKVQKGLITEGFFGLVRHPNYLGEILTYIGFCSLSMHWLPFAYLLFMFCMVLLPGMMAKEKSLSRHEEFKAYKERVAFIIPKIL